MPNSPEQILGQVNASVDALEKLSKPEREKSPSVWHAENFNNLLLLSKEALTTVDEKRWPKPIPQSAFAKTSANVQHIEILSALKQMSSILGEDVEPPGMLRG